MCLRITRISGALLLALMLGCGPNQRILESSNAATAEEPRSENVAPTATSFEQDLNSMRNADFKFILAFRRKDDKPMDAADKELISKNIGAQANRRRLSDDGRAILIGSNFPFLPDLEALQQKYRMDNYSKPDSGPLISNTASNGNVNK